MKAWTKCDYEPVLQTVQWRVHIYQTAWIASAYFNLNKAGAIRMWTLCVAAQWLRSLWNMKQFKCYTCTLAKRECVCVVMKVKPHSIDAQNRIDETLIKNSKKHDLNWLAFWWRYLSTFLHHTELFWVELGSTATIKQMCVNRSWH